MEYYIMEPIVFVLRFLEAFAEFLLIFALLNRKIEIKKTLFVSAIGMLVLTVIKTFLPQYVNSFLYPCMFILLLTFVFKEKWYVSIAISLVSMLAVAIIDCIVSYVTMVICGFQDLTQIVENTYVYIASFSSMVAIVLLLAVITYFARSNNLFANIEHAKYINIFITVGATFILLIPNLVVLLYYQDGKALPFGIVVINICSIIVLFLVNLYNTQNNIKLAKSEQDLIVQKKYSKTQQDLIDGLRTFKHDYSNTLQTMRGYVEYNKIDKLKEMFEQVLDETKAITTLDKLNPNTIKNPGLFGILSGKYQKAKESNLKMEVEIFGDIEGIDIDIFDLTRMLGILLDNAIEAAKDSKKRKIKFLLSERKSAVDIEISNTFSEKNINIDKIKEKGFSSKGKNRGLGLYKVEEIVNKYDSLKNNTIIEKDMFVQILQIDKINDFAKV